MTSTPRAFALSLLFHGGLIAATVGVVLYPRSEKPGPSGESGVEMVLSGPLVQSEPQDPAGTQDIADLQQPQDSPPAAALVPEPVAPQVVDTLAKVETTSAPIVALPETVGVPKEASPLRKTKSSGSTTKRAKSGSTGGADGEGSGNGSGSASGGFVAVRYSHCPAPPYPAAAKKEKAGGQVLLLVLVDEAGRPATVNLRRSSGNSILDAAAISGVQRWRFEPASLNGRPVTARVEVPIRFVAS